MPLLQGPDRHRQEDDLAVPLRILGRMSRAGPDAAAHRPLLRIPEKVGFMRLGILGLPQAGKTTLFEILVSNAPPRAPGSRQDRVGIVRVPDERVDRLSEMYKPKKTTFATLEV